MLKAVGGYDWKLGKGEVRVLGFKVKYYFKILFKFFGSYFIKFIFMISLITYWVSCEIFCSNC